MTLTRLAGTTALLSLIAQTGFARVTVVGAVEDALNIVAWPGYLERAAYQQQGTAGIIPLAAAFAVVSILIMIAYLWFARRMGASDAL